MTDKPTASQSALLEQFVNQIRMGNDPTEVIQKALETPNLFVFGDLLQTSPVQELSQGSNECYLNLLKLFAIGTYGDYQVNSGNLPALSAPMARKLRYLTIASLSTENKRIPYARLLKDLGLDNVRDLEDLIIDAIYANVIQGSLDQEKSLLEVDSAIGRDFKNEDLDGILEALEGWCQGCESALTNIEFQIAKANWTKTEHTSAENKTKKRVEKMQEYVAAQKNQGRGRPSYFGF